MPDPARKDLDVPWIVTQFNILIMRHGTLESGLFRSPFLYQQGKEI